MLSLNIDSTLVATQTSFPSSGTFTGDVEGITGFTFKPNSLADAGGTVSRVSYKEYVEINGGNYIGYRVEAGNSQSDLETVTISITTDTGRKLSRTIQFEVG